MNNQLVSVLQELKANNTIADFTYIHNENEEHMYESETLILRFNDGRKLAVQTGCSGVMENTFLDVL